MRQVESEDHELQVKHDEERDLQNEIADLHARIKSLRQVLRCE